MKTKEMNPKGQQKADGNAANGCNLSPCGV